MPVEELKRLGFIQFELGALGIDSLFGLSIIWHPIEVGMNPFWTAFGVVLGPMAISLKILSKASSKSVSTVWTRAQAGKLHDRWRYPII